MKIAISGLTGVGKTTVADIVAQWLDIPHIRLSFKDLAEEKGISLMEFQRLAEEDPSVDKEFDEFQKKVLKEKGQYVASTWLAPWLDDTDINVWLYAGIDTRVHRVAKREGISEDEAREYIHKKDQSNIKRYRELYGIDITQKDKFHVCINTELYTPKQVADIIIQSARITRKR